MADELTILPLKFKEVVLIVMTLNQMKRHLSALEIAAYALGQGYKETIISFRAKA